MMLKDELILRDLQDTWILLYSSMAKGITTSFGMNGSKLLRNSIRKYGTTMGSLERTIATEMGEKINLKSLFWNNFSQITDPRFKFQVQFITEEATAYDILTCPLYSYFSHERDLDLLLPYCEEFGTSFVSSYCGEASQTNLSEILVRNGEYSCRFSHYFRKANVKPEERQIHFSYECEKIKINEGPVHTLAIPDDTVIPYNVKKRAANQVLTLIESMFDTLAENPERDQVIVEILRKAKISIINYLKAQSINHNQQYNEQFLRMRCWVFELDDISKQRTATRLRQLIYQNLIAPIRNSTVTEDYLDD